MSMMAQTALLIALYVASLAILCGVARRLPILAPEAQHRVSALDGLRGLLATAVIVHHFTLTFFWHTSGQWQSTDSRLINNMGAVPVSLFFMITGYLFTRKIHRRAPHWGRLLASRLRRIYPMYLCSVACVIALSAYQTSGTLAPLGDTLSGIGHWLIFIGKPINGFADSPLVNAAVQWTLLYEAVFYLCLPLLYLVLHRRVPARALVIGLLVLAALWGEYDDYFSTRMVKLFACGIGVALLEDWLRAKAAHYSGPRWTLLALALLAVGLQVKSYSLVQALALVVPFALFVLGNSLGGVLEHRGMKVLGEASFSIYLMHGIVLYLLFSVVGVYDFSRGSLWVYAGYLPMVMLLVCSLSVATYWGIERPMILGRKALEGGGASAHSAN